MFVKGERVRVEADVSRAKSLQDGHGGWVNKMKKVIVLLHSTVHGKVIGCLRINRFYGFDVT